MRHSVDYQVKFGRIAAGTLYGKLDDDSRAFVRERAFDLRFTQQELRQVSLIARDLQMWERENIESLWPGPTAIPGQPDKKRLLRALRDQYEALKNAPNKYLQGEGRGQSKAKAIPLRVEKEKLGLGFCPVASPKTRCCNLMTLDVVENCGFGCSYCSIKSFYDGHQVTFDRDFPKKLATLPIDPDRIYHIGTGQSSDSLMWGGSGGALDALIDFAARHPNVILELKTKSANVGHLLKRRLPRNILFTWSLNTPLVIANEEHGTATLDERFEAARKLADKGALVGFHFHPMIQYAGWEQDYPAVIEQLQRLFVPDEVALVSLGTLTFTKSVIRQIREQGTRSQILKLPLMEADGKLSYPDDVKLTMFTRAFESFPHAWREGVFFYLCMENHRFWKPVFGFEYQSNDEFETAMKRHYMEKIGTGG